MTHPNNKNRTEAAKQQAGQVADTGKHEAAAVKDTAAMQAQDVKDTAVGQAQQVKDTAVGQAQEVKDTAVDAAAQVGDTAKAEVQQVAGEAVDQIRNLVDTTRGEVRTRAAEGQVALTGTLASLTDELGKITRGETTSGPVAQFAGQLASRGEGLTSWLQTHEPEDVLLEARRFAARRPMAFLALAAGAGLLAGRVGRGAREISREDDVQPHRIAGQGGVTYPADYTRTTAPYAGDYAAQPRRSHTTGYPADYTPEPTRGGYAGEFTPEGTRVSEGYVHTTPQTPGQTSQGHPGNGGVAR